MSSGVAYVIKYLDGASLPKANDSPMLPSDVRYDTNTFTRLLLYTLYTSAIQ
jgi:hypothetical protein